MSEDLTVGMTAEEVVEIVNKYSTHTWMQSDHSHDDIRILYNILYADMAMLCL